MAGTLAMLLGGWLGSLSGQGIDAPLISAALGSLSGIGVLAIFDTLRGHRLIAWLKGPQTGEPPRESGLWGEIGYRMQRSIRTLQQSVRREESRLAQFLSAIEASPNGVLLLDSNQQIEWCNSVAADHFGLDPARDLRQRLTNLVRAPEFVAFLRSEHNGASVKFSGPGGRTTLTVVCRQYGDGQLLILSQDTTELERAEAMRRDFVANVSHEIRTPLTVLVGFIETMSQLQLSEPERRRVLHLMGVQGRRMETLVADLLTLAQLEGGPLPPSDRWFSLNPILHHVDAEAKLLSTGGHELVIGSAAGVQLAGTEAELQSAIGNLVQNAVRYTPKGGQVTLNWCYLEDGSGQIDISDTGPGIARAHLSRLTERFYRVDSSRSRETGGTGLGLSIVKHAIQRHGGELHIESEIGKGSTFRLVFPAARIRFTDQATHSPLRQVSSAASIG